MKITVLGTRGEIPQSLPYHSKHTGILVNDDLLIDVGERSFLEYHPKWILITHFHPDHAYFVHRRKEEIPPTQAKIYAPEVPQFLQGKIELLLEERTLGPYTIIPIPTHHSKHVKSQGYVVQKGDTSFLFTSDLVWIDKQYHPLIGTVDWVITEASFIRKGGMVRKDPLTGKVFGHQGVPNLISLLSHFSKHFLILHFGSWFYEDTKKGRRQIQKLAEKFGVRVVIGYDGLQLEIT